MTGRAPKMLQSVRERRRQRQIAAGELGGSEIASIGLRTTLLDGVSRRRQRSEVAAKQQGAHPTPVSTRGGQMEVNREPMAYTTPSAAATSAATAAAAAAACRSADCWASPAAWHRQSVSLSAGPAQLSRRTQAMQHSPRSVQQSRMKLRGGGRESGANQPESAGCQPRDRLLRRQKLHDHSNAAATHTEDAKTTGTAALLMQPMRRPIITT